MRISLIIYCLCISVGINAQSNRAAVSDLYPINGGSETINIQDYLDQGKYVLVDIFTTWCAPCWASHKTRVLDSLEMKYGQESENDFLRVIGIELSGKTTDYDMHNESDESEGDWVTGTHYPLVNLPTGKEIEWYIGGYLVDSYPSRILICPDGSWREVYMNTIEEELSQIANDNPPPCDTIVQQDPYLFRTVGNKYSCTEETTIGVVYTNYGTNAHFIDQLVVSNRPDGGFGYDPVDTILIDRVVEPHTIDTILYTIKEMTSEIMTYRFEFINDPLKSNQHAIYTKTQKIEYTYQAPEDMYDLENYFVNIEDQVNHLNYNPGKIYSKYIYPDMPMKVVLGKFSFPNFTSANVILTLSKAAGHIVDDDLLEFNYSTDCGENWQTLWSARGNDLHTSNDSCDAIVWQEISIDIGELSGQTEVLLSMDYESDTGCEIFIENIEIGKNLVVSTSELDSKYTKIYPNPFKSIVQIEGVEDFDILTIYDFNGKQIVHRPINHPTAKLDVSRLEKGLYYFRLSGNKEQKVYKLVKG